MSFWIVVGILAPWLAGMALVHCRRGGVAGALLTIGGGWLMGQVLLMFALYASLRITGAAHAKAIAVLLMCAALAVAIVRTVIGRRAMSAGDTRRPATVTRQGTRIAASLLVVLFVVSLSAKLFSIVPGLRQVSIRNDDAISMWLFKAKVIAESDTLSFQKEDPFYLGGSNPRYPVFLPLCAAYLPLLNGGWSESLAAAPWLGFFVATPLVILGALRIRLNASVPALIAAYVVMSLPLMSVHAYRPGYADLPLATFLAAAACFALLARKDEWRIHGMLVSGLMLIGAAAMKREGPVLAGVVACVMLLPQLVAAIRQGVVKPKWPTISVIAAVIAVFMLVDLRDVAENFIYMERHGEVFASLVNHAFGWSSFNLAFWLLPIAALFVAVRPNAEMRWRAILLAVALLGIDVCIFALTPQFRFAMNDQTPSRLFMQVLPAIIVALAVPISTGLTCRTPSNSAVGEPVR